MSVKLEPCLCELTNSTEKIQFWVQVEDVVGILIKQHTIGLFGTKKQVTAGQR